MTPCQLDNSSLYRRLGTFLATSFPFTASVKPSTSLYFSLIGQHDISKHFVVSPSDLPLSCFSHSLSLAPSVENGNQRQSIFTKYNRWKPTTVDGNQSFSFVVFLILSSSAGRHFSAYDDHSISSLFPTFIYALALCCYLFTLRRP